MKKLTGKFVEVFAQALERSTDNDLKYSQECGFRMNSDLIELRKNEVESDIIPGEMKKIVTGGTLNGTLVRLTVLFQLVEKLSKYSGSLSLTGLYGSLNKFETPDGFDLFADIDREKAMLELESGNFDEELVKKVAAKPILFSIKESISQDFCMAIALQEGLLGEYRTELFVKGFIEVKEDLDANKTSLGVMADYEPYTLEIDMKNYLDLKLDRKKDSPDAAYNDVCEKLDVFQTLMHKLGKEGNHIDAIEFAIDKCLGKNESDFDLSGSPTEVISRIEAGEKLVMKPEEFDSHYRGYVKAKLGHALHEEFNRDWKKAESRVLEDYPEIAEKLALEK